MPRSSYDMGAKALKAGSLTVMHHEAPYCLLTENTQRGFPQHPACDNRKQKHILFFGFSVADGFG